MHASACATAAASTRSLSDCRSLMPSFHWPAARVCNGASNAAVRQCTVAEPGAISSPRMELLRTSHIEIVRSSMDKHTKQAEAAGKGSSSLSVHQHCSTREQHDTPVLSRGQACQRRITREPHACDSGHTHGQRSRPDVAVAVVTRRALQCNVHRAPGGETKCHYRQIMRHAI